MKLKRFGRHFIAGPREYEFYITSIEIELNKFSPPRFTATLSFVKTSRINKRISLILTKLKKGGNKK